MLTLVIGGAASGKSAYAEHLAVQSGGPRYYLATMQVWDAECAARVAKHRAMRAQKQFATVECPQNLHLVRLPQQGTALLEDLGNLAANELYRPDGSCLPPKQAAEKMLAGIEAIAAQCNHLIIVSNEVFSGGADYAGETDLYLQALAMVNNAVAAKALILPVAHDAGRLWPRNSIGKTSGTIHVTFGPVIDAGADDFETVNRELEDWIEGEIARMSGPDAGAAPVRNQSV